MNNLVSFEMILIYIYVISKLIFFWLFRTFIIGYHFGGFRNEIDEIQFHFTFTLIPCQWNWGVT